MSAVTSTMTDQEVRATNDAGSSSSASHSSTRHQPAATRRTCSPHMLSTMTLRRLEAWDLETHLLRVGQMTGFHNSVYEVIALGPR